MKQVERQNWTLLTGFAGAASALLLFAWLANAVLAGATLQFDAAIRGAVHALATDALTRVMLGITQLGSTVFLIGAGLVVVWQLRAAGRKHAAVLLIGATMGAETLSQTLKLVFHRARPETFFGLAAPNTFSFPSGHAMVSACFYGVLAAILSTRISSTRGKAGVWLLSVLIAGAIGLSRIYLGVHYPSDVLAGYAAAVIWVGAVRAGYHIWLRRRARGSAVSEQG